jgi:hypothetical protein
MPKAEIVCIRTGKPLHAAETQSAAAVPFRESEFSTLVGRAMETGADPSALVSPDHELLMLCDQIVMLKRDANGRLRELQDRTAPAPDDRLLYDRLKEAERLTRRPTLRAAKLRATTPAGIFAKAVAVRHMGISAMGLGKSLAEDLLASAELRAALWPAVETGR